MTALGREWLAELSENLLRAKLWVCQGLVVALRSTGIMSTVYEAWGPRRNNSESADYQMQDCEVLLPK
jgi:hypothetical protein